MSHMKKPTCPHCGTKNPVKIIGGKWYCTNPRCQKVFSVNSSAKPNV